MYRASSIKLLQRGTIALSTIQTSNTATITAVVVANTYSNWVGYITTENTADSNGLSSIALTNTTTVTCARTSASLANTLTCGYELVEFYARVLKSATQDFTIALAATVTSNTATITAVTTAKTLLVFRGSISNSASSQPDRGSGRLTLTNTTTVTADRGSGTTDALTCYGTAVEFN